MADDVHRRCSWRYSWQCSRHGWLLMHDFQLAWLHDFSRNLFLILLWSSMWFIDFIYCKPQLSIRDFFRNGGGNFCGGYFFSFLSIFIFFKKIVKKQLFVHFANWSSPTFKQHESANIKASKLKLTFKSLSKHSIRSFI